MESTTQGTSSTQNQATPNASVGGSPALPVGITQAQSEWTPSLQHSLAKEMVSKGQLTQEKANELLRAGGIDPIPVNATHALDQWYPKCEPGGYTMPPFRNGETLSNEAIVGFQAKLGGILSEARFTKETGNFVLSEAARTIDAVEAMTPVEHQLWKTQQNETLQKLYGPKYEENIALAQQLVEELDAKHPGLIDLLEDGAGDSALVIAQFVAQAQYLAARRG